MTVRSPGISRAAARSLLPALLIQIVASSAFAASPFFRGPLPEVQPVQPQSLVQPAGVSREDAAGVVQRQTGGRVLSTTPAQRGGANGYDVRVLVDGKRVKDVFVDDRGNVRARR